ncbi:aminotransferase-like domain-containing protein [Microbulbifer thermotolerans]|uniref:aminotransferase-like domain-containing protein n=1 Tax=Microbulbifer thermotolerans TaxID=252514 RepID=UPI0008E68A94|nr:PLP-dependent aminotransferase family protein [Microbulbifer thermotolerans]MCX2781033.1 PLP-dependent aminotransferase family protein [Microbulbifer thermotolerans]MCX2804572.1 PLP-dependent aminotransferase family protein [Microbulbifer thermotolerans]SFD01212.1 GntR family transcriptional regulator / MocR family aminotransferase [Microbulbifer thermotolerans]
MAEPLIVLDPQAQKSLQAQIREKVIQGIISGSIPPGHKMPSSRRMAEQLGVARNTVVLAYQQLVDDGFLLTRERSGFYVNEAIQQQGLISHTGSVEATAGSDDDRDFWRSHCNAVSVSRRALQPRPANWLQYPFPFVSNEYDPRLYPGAEWRECTRDIYSAREVAQWAPLGANEDDRQLLEQICTRLLPRRGIYVEPGQILLTSGLQQACYLLGQLLLGEKRSLGMVLPACAETEEIFRRTGARIEALPQDGDGPLIGEELQNSDCWFLQPNAHNPTAVTTTLERRRALLRAAAVRGAVIIENDCEHEFCYHGSPLPPLKSMSGGRSVIYLYQFPKIIDPGMQLTFIVGPKPVIQRLRALRYTLRERMPPINQRLLAKFVASGHLDAATFRITQQLRERWVALGEALLYYLPKLKVRRASCGTACWLQLPEAVDADQLQQRAEQEGLLVETVQGSNTLRIGFSSIEAEKIEAGVRLLAQLINGEVSATEETLETATGRRLSADDLRAEFPGAVLLGTNTLGESYRIELMPDGTMLGYSRNDVDVDETDTGRWWLEGDLWVRQWRNWSYGRKASFYVVAEEHRIKWFNAAGKLIDTAILVHE